MSRLPLPLEIATLGRLEVRIGGRAVPAHDLAADDAGALLARLLVSPAAIGADDLARDLWPGRHERRRRLAAAAAGLRGVLHPHDPDGTWRLAISEGGPCRLMMGADDHWDVNDLRRRAQALRAAPPQFAPLLADRVEALCRGALLPGLPHRPWLATARLEAETLQRAALEEVAGVLERRGEWHAAERLRRRMHLPACHIPRPMRAGR